MIIDNCIISESKENFQTWVNKKYIPDILKNELYSKDILFLPLESYGDQEGPFYYQEVDDLYNFFKQNLPKDISLDLCSQNEELLILKDADYKFGTILATSLLLPILVNLTTDFLENKFIKLNENPSIEINYIVVRDKDKESRNFEFKGKAEDFVKASDKIVKVMEHESKTTK